jgi:hypothetical protein
MKLLSGPALVKLGCIPPLVISAPHCPQPAHSCRYGQRRLRHNGRLKAGYLPLLRIQKSSFSFLFCIRISVYSGRQSQMAHRYHTVTSGVLLRPSVLECTTPTIMYCVLNIEMIKIIQIMMLITIISLPIKNVQEVKQVECRCQLAGLLLPTGQPATLSPRIPSKLPFSISIGV